MDYHPLLWGVEIHIVPQSYGNRNKLRLYECINCLTRHKLNSL